MGTMLNDCRPRILVTGSTGYIGGRLVPQLLEKGYKVRCVVRDAARLQGRIWQSQVEICEGDVLRSESLGPAMEHVQVAYYLIHSMAGGSNFRRRDLEAARNFGNAARAAGVDRLVYLGGLADSRAALSEHLRSRQQTGEELRASGVPVTEFRAAVIVGSGGISFEIIRHLTERLPVMICPRWVYTRTQPIAIQDVLDYLVAALEVPESRGRTIEIGGGDIITYREMMMTYAQERGLKRWMLPVPVLTPRLSSYWVNLVTPIPASIARPLIEGLRNENIVRDPIAGKLFPHIQPVDYRTAVRTALAKLEAREVDTAWCDALCVSQGDAPPVTLSAQEGMVIEQRRRVVRATPETIYRVITGIGGKRGWFFLNKAWELRGFLDRLVGGVGLRRGRRDPDGLRVGDALDFWRVEALEPPRHLRLRAEMKLPGTAWLQFQLMPQGDGASLLLQTAYFAPKGLYGILYWYGLYPIHGLIFSGLIDRISRRAVALDREKALEQK